MSDEFMETGDLVAMADGWYLDVNTNNKISPEGVVYSEAGEVIWDPVLDEEYNA